MLPAWVNQRNKGQRALHAFIDKCHSAHLHTPYVISKLYNTLVSTVGGYGCEIWGPGAILAALETAGGMGKNILRLHITFSCAEHCMLVDKLALPQCDKSYSCAHYLLRKGSELLEPGGTTGGRGPSMSVLRGRSESARNMGTSTHTSCACSPMYLIFLY